MTKHTIMTRINVAVRPIELTDKHLIAEHREIKRIPNCIKKGRYNLDGMPDKFTLGTGHVKFFYNKLEYLHYRYLELYDECIKRGFNVTDYSECFDDLPADLYNWYDEQPNDRTIILQRINERLNK
jgi:deoxyribonuclease (pyrimidine dimer)